MPAMMGDAKEVPPAPDHALGSAPQAAKRETSGVSRKPSGGLPKTDCQEGLGHPAQEPLTTPGVDGVPVAHWLGPPPPAAVVMRSEPIRGSLQRLVEP